MELSKIQEDIKDLVTFVDSKQKGEHNSDTTFIHLIEELGEIARQLYNVKVGRDKLDLENLSEEISDCMIMLIQLANNYEIDVEASLKGKINKLRERFNVPATDH